jgi:hypothetical protein
MRLRAVRRLPLVAVALAAAVAFPLGVIASHQFSDVPNTNTFHADIDAIADAGVTTGCAPGKYCPKDFVTREQMAAFLNRLGALGPGKTPVVNADLVDGLNSTQLVRSDVAVEGHFVCGATDLVPRETGYEYNTGSGTRYATSAFGVFQCAVHLPDGAVVTALRCGITDTTATGNAQCQLDRWGIVTQVAGIQMAQTTLAPVAETPGFHVQSDETIQLPVIDNAAYQYVAQVYLSGPLNPTTSGLRIDYTTTGSFTE